jgi:hypothetical protein
MKRKRTTKSERVAARATVGALGPRLLAKQTLKVYEEAVQHFRQWLLGSRKTWPEHVEELDELLQEFIEDWWKQGETKADVANLLSALSHPTTGCARVGQFLKGSWKLYSLWSHLEKKERCLPIRLKTCRAIAGQALRHGWHDVAFCLLLAFHCLLRTVEFTGVRVGDFIWTMQGQRGVLQLCDTKSSKRTHVEESVTLEDHQLCAFGRALSQGKLPGDKLLECSPKVLRRKLRQLLDELGLGSLNIMPYSFRRGGATEHFRRFNSMAKTTARGRWSSQKTARIYVQEALAEKELQGTEREETRLTSAETVLVRFFTT